MHAGLSSSLRTVRSVAVHDRAVLCVSPTVFGEGVGVLLVEGLDDSGSGEAQGLEFVVDGADAQVEGQRQDSLKVAGVRLDLVAALQGKAPLGVAGAVGIGTEPELRALALKGRCDEPVSDVVQLRGVEVPRG